MPGKKGNGNIAGTVRRLIEPVALEQGVELWDVEFKKEGAAWFLRVYIDREGGVGVEDCERFSRAIDGILDEADPIKQGYYLEVSSPGIERPLRRESDFARFAGQRVLVRFYAPKDGVKELQGELAGLEDGIVTIKPDGGAAVSFPRSEASLIRLCATF